LNLTTPKGALAVRLPDREWITDPARDVRDPEQLGDVFHLGETLRRIVCGRRGRQLEAIASLSDDDGQTQAVHIQYGYDLMRRQMFGVRFLRDPAHDLDDIVAEFDLDTRAVRFGETRWP
jgi:hypothetical protein